MTVLHQIVQFYSQREQNAVREVGMTLVVLVKYKIEAVES